MDTEGLELPPGQAWGLEELWLAGGDDREGLLRDLGAPLAVHHPPLPVAAQPTGWCSWYWYGPQVSESDILENLRAIAEHRLPLRQVQIDDGFQAAMGDWLVPGDRFPAGMESLCSAIREAGCEPATWVAPFIAEGESRLARGAPGLARPEPGGGPAFVGRCLVRGLAPGAVVHAGRHPSGGPGLPRRGLPHDARGLGLPLLQAGRPDLGGAARGRPPRPRVRRASKPTAGGWRPSTRAPAGALHPGVQRAPVGLPGAGGTGCA